MYQSASWTSTVSGLPQRWLRSWRRLWRRLDLLSPSDIRGWALQLTNPPPDPHVTVDTNDWNAGVKQALGVNMDRALMHVQSQCVTQNGRGLFEYDSTQDLFVLSLRPNAFDVARCPYLQNVEEVWVLSTKVPYQQLMEQS